MWLPNDLKWKHHQWKPNIQHHFYKKNYRRIHRKTSKRVAEKVFFYCWKVKAQSTDRRVRRVLFIVVEFSFDAVNHEESVRAGWDKRMTRSHNLKAQETERPQQRRCGKTGAVSAVRSYRGTAESRVCVCGWEDTYLCRHDFSGSKWRRNQPEASPPQTPARVRSCKSNLKGFALNYMLHNSIFCYRNIIEMTRFHPWVPASTLHAGHHPGLWRPYISCIKDRLNDLVLNCKRSSSFSSSS